MKQIKLSTKFLIVSSIVLVAFSLASSLILYKAQSLQAIQEMDTILKNETLSLSTLIDTTTGDIVDFEMSPQFLTQFQKHNPNGFFRFINPQTKDVLKESFDSPNVDCAFDMQNKNITSGNTIYRTSTLLFRPEIDGELKDRHKINSPLVCLVVGIDEAPYLEVVTKTLSVSIPLLLIVAFALIGTMLFLVSNLTKDISVLTKALATNDFAATHAFPSLPEASTVEVKAVVEKLEGLHMQASDSYKEMWLFLSRAAHQIKTPVTAMQTTLEVLLRKERTREDLLTGLEDVKTATSHLSSLTKKLISSSRISYLGTSEKEQIYLKAFFIDLISLFSSQAKEANISIEVENADDFKIYSNRLLLADIFGNLIENALLYSPINSKVTIHWVVNDFDILLEVSDQGPGFNKEVQTTLFQPFVRGDERKIQGSGLGLSIVKKSVQLLDGWVELKESTSKGSKLTVNLPLHR